MLMCGPRLGELHVLHVDDVEIHAQSGWLPIRRGKGSQPRNAPIKAGLRPILSRWIAVRWVWPGADTCALWQSTQGRRAAGSTLIGCSTRSAPRPTCRCPRTRCGTPSLSPLPEPSEGQAFRAPSGTCLTSILTLSATTGSPQPTRQEARVTDLWDGRLPLPERFEWRVGSDRTHPDPGAPWTCLTCLNPGDGA